MKTPFPGHFLPSIHPNSHTLYFANFPAPAVSWPKYLCRGITKIPAVLPNSIATETEDIAVRKNKKLGRQGKVYLDMFPQFSVQFAVQHLEQNSLQPRFGQANASSSQISFDFALLNQPRGHQWFDVLPDLVSLLLKQLSQACNCGLAQNHVWTVEQIL
jgi:hypothetical protein